MDITGLNKAEVLAALYNASRPQGMGFLQYVPGDVSADVAEQWLQRSTYFDYIQGRVMKVDLSTDTLDTRSYNRDNGDSAAEKVIEALRESQSTSNAVTQNMHTQGRLDAARNALNYMTTPTTVDGNVVALGLSDVADVLLPKVLTAISE